MVKLISEYDTQASGFDFSTFFHFVVVGVSICWHIGNDMFCCSYMLCSIVLCFLLLIHLMTNCYLTIWFLFTQFWIHTKVEIISCYVVQCKLSRSLFRLNFFHFSVCCSSLCCQTSQWKFTRVYLPLQVHQTFWRACLNCWLSFFFLFFSLKLDYF